MTTIGQRIKNFRKNIGLSQADLAGKIGVTSQTVSKWECDVGLPDIIQIVPLADVLDVSTDAILGADSNMEKNVEVALAAVEEKWRGRINDQSTDSTRYHYKFDLFNVYRELLRRYPMNYEVALRGARCGNSILYARGRGLPEIEGLSIQSVLRDVERMCRAVINYDDDISNKAEAKRTVAEAMYFAGDYDKAEDELAGLPWQYVNLAKCRMAVFTGDGDARLACSKNRFSKDCCSFLWALRDIADSYSALGIAYKEQTYQACANLIAFCDRSTDFCDVRQLLYFKRIGYLLTAQNKIREGDYDGALDAIEALTDVVAEYKKTFEGGRSVEPSGVYYDGADEDEWYAGEGARNYFDDTLMWAVSDFVDRTGNPVVTSERYKACVARIEAAK